MSGRGRGRGGRHDGPGLYDDRRYDDDRHDRGRWGRPPDGRGRDLDRRRGEGLGYDERDGRGRRGEGHDRRDAWERDRGGGAAAGGRGRGSSDVSFVRGDVEHGAGGHHGAAPGMGRGRGRGRGRGATLPAWMAGGAADGPTGSGGGGAAAADDPSLDDLLARARQAKTEQQVHQRPPAPSRWDRPGERTTGGPPRPASGGVSSEDEAARRQAELRREEESERKAEEERREEAKRQAEQEERIRNEREEAALLALVQEDGGGGSGKRGAADGEQSPFEFETDEEREARLAKKRREERKKRLRVAADTSVERKEVGEATTAVPMEVDEPRNAAGIIKSEVEDRAALRERASNAGGASQRRDEPEKTGDGPTETREDDGADSFDIFAEDGDTPAPADGAAAAAGRAGSAAAASAQECDDADGYYKPTSGEVIGLRREGRDGGGGGDASGRMEYSNFRVLGLIGKGVFSSVVKCVEEPEDGAGGAAAPAGRVVAMKIIRNNEIMAKAALKEMRILRMLCRYRPSGSVQKRKKARRQQLQGQDGNGDGNDNNEDEDEEELDRRRHENFHIVRLLDVDPDFSRATAASSASSGGDPAAYYAVPPPSYRNHSCFLFEYIPYNLREVLGKFGSGVGINLAAVRSYARQLFVALVHLEKHRVVHADLKVRGMRSCPLLIGLLENSHSHSTHSPFHDQPDNILVSANFSTIKLADFGR